MNSYYDKAKADYIKEHQGVPKMSPDILAVQKRNTKKYRYKSQKNPVITGYFVKEKSYKEIIIARINAALCGMLAFLVLACLVSYYFVVINEVKLQKISKETIALNYENSDMQNKLDNLQSFSNVDFEISKTNRLQRAQQVIELSAADLPAVDYKKTSPESMINWSLGY